MGKDLLLIFAKTVNDLDDRLPKGRSECFDIGSWGGCGFSCPVFHRGECGEPVEVFEQCDISDVDSEDYDDLKVLYNIK